MKRKNAVTNTQTKKPIPGELFLVAAMVLNSLAVTLMIKADFGISAISSVPYVLYVAFPVMSLGTWNALIQCAWLVITMLAIRKIKPGYLFSFVLAFVFGLMLDGWEALMAPWTMAMAARIGYYAAGFGIMSVGISLFFLCGTPVLPFDTVPRAFVLEKGLSVRTARTAFDLINLVLSLSVSLLFVGRIVGIGIGTVVSALFIGTVASKITEWLKARYEVKPHFEILGKLV